MSTNDGTQKQNTVEVENHHCSKCGWERLLWRPQDKCAHVLICPLCLMTRPHSSQECDKYTGSRIEKLEVQVEVYRKALEAIAESGGGEHEGYCESNLTASEEAKQALLTSKSEVAPVRKWEADDVIGQTIVSGKAFDFYFGDATREVQDALRGRKG